MGFSGGGSNVLLPHTHDGTVAQDGGPLDFNNVTQSQSSAGQVFYSDGAHLQQLAYPGVPANETLTAAALSTAPSWAAAAPAATVWTELADVTLGVAGQLSSGSFAAHDILDIWMLGANTSSQNTAITFNGSGASNYKNNQMIDGVYASNTGNTEVTIYGANTSTVSYIHLNTFYDTTSTETGYTWQGTNFSGGGGGVPISYSGWGYYYGPQITQVDKSQYGAVAINQSAGARVVVLGAN
jgi:hypothetical protein